MNNKVFRPGFATPSSLKASPRREGSADSPSRSAMAERGASSRTMGVMRVLVTLVGLLWCALVSRADTHYVSLDGTNDSVNGYITWAGAATQIQWAINAAAAGETVLVSNGTYNLTNQIFVTNNITVQSLNGTNVTIVNGNYPAGTNRCFYISNGVLDGLTVSNGYASGVYYTQGGGGIYIETGSVFNCFIYGNYCSNKNNIAVGGGICIKGSGIVSNCTVISNTISTNAVQWWTGGGGGIGTWNASGTIMNSRISGNMASNIGGGLYLGGDVDFTIIVTNCLVDGNSATRGCGGACLYYSSVMKNCVISNNIVTDTGA